MAVRSILRAPRRPWGPLVAALAVPLIVLAGLHFRAVHTQPTGFLPVKVDGRRTYFEWISAGKYISAVEAMASVIKRLMSFLLCVATELPIAVVAEINAASMPALKSLIWQSDRISLQLTGVAERQQCFGADVAFRGRNRIAARV